MDSLAPLGGLFVSAFLAATVLPGGSEVVLYALLAHDPAALWPALAVATLGNTLGALTSYLLGRLLPASRRASPRALDWIRRGGAAVLLLSWVPVIGDALCVAAGWLRIPPGRSALFIVVGKFARYWVVAQAAV
ncbi:MAG: DedA family protein [Burkholderiales bacterium]|nr:DedA family protein [Burkholderiales bacterium]